jgi:K+-transporting ATPase ATPase A chain
MKLNDFLQIGLYVLLLTVLTPLLGSFMAKVFKGEKNILSPVFGGIEKLIYRISGINKDEEMSWKTYLFSLLMFNFFGFIVVLMLQLLQSYLPLNPQGLPNVPFHLSFNTAVSFMTNTNWQSYAGETTLSYLVQMAGLTVQNFVSAATGIAVILGLIRAFTKRNGSSIGNFWTDMVRSVLYVLLPLSIIMTLLLVSQGVVQTFSSYATVTTISGQEQIIPLGPAASQIAIKQIGTNGGGFFNVNSAFPFENPTPFSNFLEMLAILLIPAALTYTYGKMIKNQKHGWIIFSAMITLFAAGLIVSLISEYQYNPVTGTNINLEGKEQRFGVTNSVLWSVATTDASNGSVNAMHDSMTPLSGMTAILNMMLGEVIFGGVGAGLYGMLIFIIITVFIAGLMVGRTPEYLGKKIEALDIKMAVIAVLLPSVCILVFSSIAVVISQGLSSLNNSGPHGLSEILYAFTSGAGNNGSAFAGLNANTPFYNITLGIDMLIGRFGVIIPALVIAGNIVKKNIAPAGAGTFSTNSGLFVILLIGVILIIGGLTFFPVLTLGPIVEQLLMKSAIVF